MAKNKALFLLKASRSGIFLSLGSKVKPAKINSVNSTIIDKKMNPYTCEFAENLV
jgi:hypothetical protein